jgi:hypothetical protein
MREIITPYLRLNKLVRLHLSRPSKPLFYQIERILNKLFTLLVEVLVVAAGDG